MEVTHLRSFVSYTSRLWTMDFCDTWWWFLLSGWCLSISYCSLCFGSLVILLLCWSITLMYKHDVSTPSTNSGVQPWTRGRFHLRLKPCSLEMSRRCLKVEAAPRHPRTTKTAATVRLSLMKEAKRWWELACSYSCIYNNVAKGCFTDAHEDAFICVFPVIRFLLQSSVMSSDS